MEDPNSWELRGWLLARFRDSDLQDDERATALNELLSIQKALVKRWTDLATEMGAEGEEYRKAVSSMVKAIATNEAEPLWKAHFGKEVER